MKRRGKPKVRRHHLHCFLDLHGATHDEAEDLVHRFINDHWVGGWVLHIITGRSEGMKAVVARVARGYDVDWHEDPWNPGSVKIFT